MVEAAAPWPGERRDDLFRGPRLSLSPSPFWAGVLGLDLGLVGSRLPLCSYTCSTPGGHGRFAWTQVLSCQADHLCFSSSPSSLTPGPDRIPIFSPRYLWSCSFPKSLDMGPQISCHKSRQILLSTPLPLRNRLLQVGWERQEQLPPVIAGPSLCCPQTLGPFPSFVRGRHSSPEDGFVAIPDS